MGTDHEMQTDDILFVITSDPDIHPPLCSSLSAALDGVQDRQNLPIWCLTGRIASRYY
jgi:hypothetical protein